MTRKKAKELVELYTTGWEEENLNKILAPLDNNCQIIESHGPVYSSREEVEEWVKSWFKEGYKVKKWQIISFLFFRDTAVFEWRFTFLPPKQKARVIEGVTVARFRKDKISYWREYRTTQPLYRWKERKGEIKKFYTLG